MRRIAIAQDTLKIIEAGYYCSPEGKRIELAQKIASCLEQIYCCPMVNFREDSKASYFLYLTLLDKQKYLQNSIVDLSQATKTYTIFQKFAIIKVE